MFVIAQFHCSMQIFLVSLDCVAINRADIELLCLASVCAGRISRIGQILLTTKCLYPHPYTSTFVCLCFGYNICMCMCVCVLLDISLCIINDSSAYMCIESCMQFYGCLSTHTRTRLLSSFGFNGFPLCTHFCTLPQCHLHTYLSTIYVCDTVRFEMSIFYSRYDHSMRTAKNIKLGSYINMYIPFFIGLILSQDLSNLKIVFILNIVQN